MQVLDDGGVDEVTVLPVLTNAKLSTDSVEEL